MRPAALEGKAKVELYDVRGEVAESQYHFLWPNLTININPGFPNLSVDVWLPDGPNATRGFSEQYFGPGVDEGFAEALMAFNKQVAQEDDDLTDSVQHGLVGGLPDRGQFPHQERTAGDPVPEDDCAGDERTVAGCHEAAA